MRVSLGWGWLTRALRAGQLVQWWVTTGDRSMLALIVVAGFEAALALIMACAGIDAIGTRHQFWYFEIPLLFLVLPALGLLLAIKFGRAIDHMNFGLYTLIMLLFFVNFMAFACYALASGGGV